jgi:D-arabinitol dehydrogenase (NADP+)
MRAAVYDKPNAVDVRDVPDPRPGPGEVVVRIEMCGICGTDDVIFAGRFFSEYPLIPGHEPTGIVETVGEGVTTVTPGQRVAVNGNSGCGACRSCQRGNPLMCRNLKALGVNGPGGFAELMLAPAAQVFPVDDLPVEVAVLTEPTACAMHGMDVLRPAPGSDVLVFGAGPTGLILAQLILHGGASRVTVAAPSAFKLDLARSYGIHETVQADRGDASLTARRARDLAPDGFDVVVDATGSAAVTEAALTLAADGGTVLVYGVTDPADRVAMSPFDVYRRELTIKGSFAQVLSFPMAVAMLRSGHVRTEGMISHRFALADFASAIRSVKGDPTVHKAVVTP